MIITMSKIFKNVRRYVSSKYFYYYPLPNKPPKKGTMRHVWYFVYHTFTCFMCCGTWVGMIFYIPLYREISINNIFYGFISAISSYFLCKFVSLLEKK